jgi:ABC-type lipoprotein release transport system permease subunit
MFARQTHRAPRSRTQTHGQRHWQTTGIDAIGIMSTHFSDAAFVLMAVAVIASVLPAADAARVDVMEALCSE